MGHHGTFDPKIMCGTVDPHRLNVTNQPDRFNMLNWICDDSEPRPVFVQDGSPL